MSCGCSPAACQLAGGHRVTFCSASGAGGGSGRRSEDGADWVSREWSFLLTGDQIFESGVWWRITRKELDGPYSGWVELTHPDSGQVVTGRPEPRQHVACRPVTYRRIGTEELDAAGALVAGLLGGKEVQDAGE